MPKFGRCQHRKWATPISVIRAAARDEEVGHDPDGSGPFLPPALLRAGMSVEDREGFGYLVLPDQQAREKRLILRGVRGWL